MFMIKAFFQRAINANKEENRETALAEKTVLQFKTDLRCGACVQKVAPFLDALEGVERWEVALEKPERFLTVYGTITSEHVQKGLVRAGYSAEKV